MRVLVPYSRGVEEIELVTVVDVLRRAGAHVTLASLDGHDACGRSGIWLRPDEGMAEAGPRTWELVVLPGGQPNARTLQTDPRVREVVQRTANEGGRVAAICAAPVALAAFGVMGSRAFTCFPGTQSHVVWHAPGAVHDPRAVVDDDRVITSAGPGTAMEFALYLAAMLCGGDVAERVRADLVA